MVKHKLFSMALGATLLCVSLFALGASPAHAASKASANAEIPIQWTSGAGGCSYVTEVQLTSNSGSGYIDCFYLFNSSDWGYLGLGDGRGPGNASDVIEMDTGLTYYGWIRYYNTTSPNGAYCEFGRNERLKFTTYPLYVTQISLNTNPPYPSC